METAAVLTSRHFSMFWRNICLHLQGGRGQASQSHILERGNFHSRCLGGFQTAIIFRSLLYSALYDLWGLENFTENLTITFDTFWETECYLPSRRCYQCPTVVALLNSSWEVTVRVSLGSLFCWSPAPKGLQFPFSQKSQIPLTDAKARSWRMSKLESLRDRALSGRKNECPLGAKNLFTAFTKLSVVTNVVVVPCD